MKNVYEECPKFENERWLLRLVAKDGVAFNGYWIFNQ